MTKTGPEADGLFAAPQLQYLTFRQTSGLIGLVAFFSPSRFDGRQATPLTDFAHLQAAVKATATRLEAGMAEHLIPFRGKCHSGSVNQNLLWHDGRVYLMDNHRAALWCWQQEIDLYQTLHSLLHIDRHTDCLSANLDAHIDVLPDLRGLTLKDYLDASVALPGGDAPLFRWDNYLSLHLKLFSDQVSVLRSIDHGDGDTPDHPATIRPGADEVPPNLLYWLRNGPAPWIVNVDLDYFFFEAAGDGLEGNAWLPMYSDKFIDTCFGEIKGALDEGLIGVVTLCLTPSNFTPGWNDCLKLSSRIFDILGATHPDL